MRIRIGLVLVLFAFLALLADCKPGGDSRQPKPTADPTRDAAVAAADLAKLDGSALFASLCSVCHGQDGTGYKADNAPSLVNRTFLESATDEQLRRSIVTGRPGTSMAGYGKEVGGPLDPPAVERLLTWIRGHDSSRKAIPAAGPGDVTRGATVYTASCERCHGTAATRGNAVHLANSRFLEVAGDPFLRWAIVNGRPGTPMEAWQGKLSDAQIDDVVTYLRSLGRPPPAATLPPPTGTEPMVLNPGGKQPDFKLRSDPCPAIAPAAAGAPGAKPPPTPTCTPNQRYVSVDQVNQALADNRKMVIIDARPASEWMHVHVTGAVSVPYHAMKRLDELANDGTFVIAYCACPHHLSGNVVDELRRRGYKNAVILDEGILEWHRRGYPVVTAPGETPPPGGPSPDAASPATVPMAR